jgi:hypothetical protein
MLHRLKTVKSVLDCRGLGNRLPSPRTGTGWGVIFVGLLLLVVVLLRSGCLPLRSKFYFLVDCWATLAFFLWFRFCLACIVSLVSRWCRRPLERLGRLHRFSVAEFCWSLLLQSVRGLWRCPSCPFFPWIRISSRGIVLSFQISRLIFC